MLKELAQSYDASMKSQTDIITQLAAQNIAQNKVIEGLVPRVGNTNNHVNVNVYLDQRCGRAINISDFVASLRIGPSEIAYTCSNGLAQGVTNVLVDGLSRLDTSMRPIQCTDAGQETMYVRENDRWSEDLDQGRIKSAINQWPASRDKRLQIGRHRILVGKKQKMGNKSTLGSSDHLRTT